MSTISIIGGIYLVVMLTIIRIFIIIKRFPSFRDRFIELFNIPRSIDRRDELILVLTQAMAVLYILLGIAIKFSSLEEFLRNIPFGGLLGYIILLVPIYILIFILRCSVGRLKERK